MIEVKNLEKSFEQKKQRIPVLDNISLDVRKNEFLVILGPGLCGKSVLINLLAGLDAPTKGTVLMNGTELKGVNEQAAVVFQRTGLMPWKTVIDNVAFGPKMKGVGKKERNELAQTFINMVGLEGFERAYPHQLSGGMKQRAGIARAYAKNPEILLMDEPFGALDAQTRIAMREELLRIWQENKRTVVFVTNNLEEAIYLGDRIILLSAAPGKVKAEYTPPAERPRDYFAPEFLSLRLEISDATDLSIVN